MAALRGGPIAEEARSCVERTLVGGGYPSLHERLQECPCLTRRQDGSEPPLLWRGQTRESTQENGRMLDEGWPGAVSAGPTSCLCYGFLGLLPP